LILIGYSLVHTFRLVVRSALDLADDADVYQTGYWAARKYTVKPRRGASMAQSSTAMNTF
jgi:hypothetical protein